MNGEELKMLTKLYVKDFKITSHWAGSQLRGQENLWEYTIYTADGKKYIKGGFYRRSDAQHWLSKTVREANEILKRRNAK